jgi:hypothetical protein
VSPSILFGASRHVSFAFVTSTKLIESGFMLVPLSFLDYGRKWIKGIFILSLELVDLDTKRSNRN